MIRFAEPAYFLLLIPAAIGLWFSFKHVQGMMRSRKVVAFAMRSLLVLLLVAALAGPEAHRPNKGMSTVFIVDRSDSISEQDKQQAIAFISESLKHFGPDDEAGVIAFGSDAVIEIAPSNMRSINRILSVTDASATDLAAAIRLASASHSEGKAKRIVVLSDGNETDGDAAGAAEVASTDQVQIDYVALGSDTSEPEVSVLDLNAPSEVAIGQTFELRATVDSTISGEAVLRLDRDGVVLQETRVKLSPGKSQFLLSDTLDKPGFNRYRLTLDSRADTDNRNNIGATFVSVEGKPRILVIQQDATPGPFVNALREQGLVVDVNGPSGIPTRADELQVYEAVIFNDVNAATTTVSQMKLLQAAIRDTGIGFAMIGGENSFLPGGYYGTPIAEALPVDLNIRQRKTFPSTSLLIVVDASGSMSMVENGVPKIRLAAKAAETTVNLMAAKDRVGVAGSTDGVELVAPMQTVGDKQAVISQVRKLTTGGGGIYVKPSLDFAANVLLKEDSKVRHLILLADGQDCDSQEGCIPLAAELLKQKITTSVIAFGDGPHIPFLKQLAAAGGGNYYLARTASELPAIFTQDAAIMSRSAIEEGVFLPKSVAGVDILRGINPNSVPALYAYCLTSDRPLATVGMWTAKDDPLLATWQYGLGMSLAFTSDAQARWGARWVTWSQFGAFWGQAVRTITRRATRNDYQVTARHEGASGILEINAFDSFGNPINGSAAKARVSTPEGNSFEVPLTQKGPGSYEGKFAASELGSYVVTIAEPDGRSVSNSGFSIPYPPEYKRYRANTPLLERMSKSTGGIALSSPEQVGRLAANPGTSISPLWSLFVLLSALLLPLDVASRRLALPVGAMLAKLIGFLKARPARKQPAVVIDARVERLNKAKERAHQPAPAAEKTEATATVHTTTASAATKLLEAKRRRDE